MLELMLTVSELVKPIEIPQTDWVENWFDYANHLVFSL